jgi:hypothetical protein
MGGNSWQQIIKVNNIALQVKRRENNGTSIGNTNMRDSVPYTTIFIIGDFTAVVKAGICIIYVRFIYRGAGAITGREFFFLYPSGRNHSLVEDEYKAVSSHRH